MFKTFVSICLCVVRIWDVRPFAPKERCVKIFQGNVHNFEKVRILNFVFFFKYILYIPAVRLSSTVGAPI